MLQHPLRSLAYYLLVVALLAGVAGSTGCRKKTPEDRFQEAQQLLQENQIPLAVLKMRDLIGEHPDAEIIPEVRLTLAGVYARLGRTENLQSAMDQLRRVYEDLPIEDERAFIAHQMIIEIHLMSEEHELALEQAAAGIERAPEDSEVREPLELLRGTLQLAVDSEEDNEKARDFFKSVMLESDDPALRGQAREMLAQHYRMREMYRESNDVYQTWLDTFPDDSINPMLIMAQGLNLRDMDEENEEAEVLFARGAGEFLQQIEEELDGRRRVQKLNELATLFERFGSADRAEEQLRRIMAEVPMSESAIRAQIGIGELYLREERVDDAIALFKQIKAENPNSVISQVADQYLELIREVEALRAADEEARAAELLEEHLEPVSEEMP